MVWQLVLALQIIWIFNIYNLIKITGIHYNGEKPTIMAPLSILPTPKPIFTILHDILNIILSLLTKVTVYENELDRNMSLLIIFFSKNTLRNN